MMKASGMIVNGDTTEHHSYMKDYRQLFAWKPSERYRHSQHASNVSPRRLDHGDQVATHWVLDLLSTASDTHVY
jgi:hypothetical protein